MYLPGMSHVQIIIHGILKYRYYSFVTKICHDSSMYKQYTGSLTCFGHVYLTQVISFSVRKILANGMLANQ